MTKYRVEIDGTEVWAGEGDTYKVIPAEYLARPDDTPDDEPHPSPHWLFEQVDGDDEQVIGVQTAMIDELEQVIAAGDADGADDRTKEAAAIAVGELASLRARRDAAAKEGV